MNDLAELEDRMRVALRVDADSAPVRHLSPEQFRATLSDDDGAPMAGPTVARRRPLSQRGLVAAALIAGVITGVVALTMTGSSTAFASWISRPGTISESDSAALDVECRESDPSLGRPEIVDRRGHSAYAVYASGSETTDCLMTVPGETPDKGLPKVGSRTRGSARQRRRPSSHWSCCRREHLKATRFTARRSPGSADGSIAPSPPSPSPSTPPPRRRSRPPCATVVRCLVARQRR